LHVAITTSRGQYLSLTPEVQEELALPRTGADSRSSELPPAAAESPAAGEITRALEDVRGNVTQAANRLGLSRHALHRLIKAHGIVKRFDSE
jgi:transcriptional regulator of acetoin/glycerol metabolism